MVENDNLISVTALDMIGKACAAELAEQDGHLGSVIGDGFVATVEGDTLTLMDPGRVGLVYRVSE